MKICSENSCNLKAIKEVGIRGESHLTDKKYIVQIYVCKFHYEIEKCEGSIVNETSIPIHSGGSQK
jgi:hypothetical protein